MSTQRSSTTVEYSSNSPVVDQNVVAEQLETWTATYIGENTRPHRRKVSEEISKQFRQRETCPSGRTNGKIPTGVWAKRSIKICLIKIGGSIISTDILPYRHGTFLMTPPPPLTSIPLYLRTWLAAKQDVHANLPTIVCRRLHIPPTIFKYLHPHTYISSIFIPIRFAGIFTPLLVSTIFIIPMLFSSIYIYNIPILLWSIFIPYCKNAFHETSPLTFSKCFPSNLVAWRWTFDLKIDLFETTME